MTRNIQLLLIDPQNDFCDLPEAWCTTNPLTGRAVGPALPVPGAHADMLRLASFIDDVREQISGITVTLDSHYRLHIAHPTFWQKGPSGGSGAAVTPFTQITAADVRAGIYSPRDASALPRALAYLDALESRGRYTLMVWPVHCEMGSWGHNVHAAIQGACNRWEDRRLGMARKIAKGSNLWTENYSALQAEVPDENDPATQLNRALIADYEAADLIVVAGEASSHCVKATTEDLVANLPAGQIRHVVLLSDCMSPVSGFEAQQTSFLNAMRSRGVQVLTAAAMRDVLLATA